MEHYNISKMISDYKLHHEFEFEIDFTNEYGQHVYDIEELQPGLAKIVLKNALAELKLQNAVHEILDFDKVED